MHRRPLLARLTRLAIPIAAAAIPALALASAEQSPRQLMRFGVEAARQGLWREAVSRWERAVKQDAENPRLRNNLAVAYESLGRFSDADREYREARRLAPDSLEVRDNHRSFLLMHPAFRLPDDAVPAAPATPGAAATPGATTTPAAPGAPGEPSAPGPPALPDTPKPPDTAKPPGTHD